MAEVARLYRNFLREVSKSVSTWFFRFPLMDLLIRAPQSLVPRPQRSKTLARHYRALFEQPRNGPNAIALSCEVENAVKFLRHQREYKVGGPPVTTMLTVLKGLCGQCRAC